MDKRSKGASEASGAPASVKTTNSSGWVTEGQRSHQAQQKQIQFNIKKISKDKVGPLLNQSRTQIPTLN